jgi:acyl-CoA thioester hydrolase
MGRVKVVLPETFAFSTQVEVHISDINYAGHLGNDALLALLHEARVRFLRSWGYGELDIEGAGLIMLDAEVAFRAEAFHGEALLVELAVGGLTSHGCEFLYRVTSSRSSKEVARARTGMAFFDYQRRALVPVPEGFRTHAEFPDTQGA